MNEGILKTVATKDVSCEICGSKVRRNKTFKMTASENDIEQAKAILMNKVREWKLTNKQKHCHICWFAVKDLK